MGNQRSCAIVPRANSQYGGPLANGERCHLSVAHSNKAAVPAGGFPSNGGNLFHALKTENGWKRQTQSDNAMIQGLENPFGNQNNAKRFFENPHVTLSEPKNLNEVKVEKENLKPEFKSFMSLKSSHLHNRTTKFSNSKPNQILSSANAQQESSGKSSRASTELQISLETPRSSMVEKLCFFSEEILNPASGITILSPPASEDTVNDGVFGGSSFHGGTGLCADDIPLRNVRNFSIIAHVDHGKSTLADRLLERTGAIQVTATTDNKQVLDRLQVEKERGITVKAQTASLFYKHKGEDYLLNLIDTPGHVDFSNEVSRSLAACQGVILLVDANQGVQAQTVANYHLAANQQLTVLPVLNKIDLPNAMPDQVKDQLFNLFTIDPDDVLMISAKTGAGVDELLEALVDRVPVPPGDRAAPFRALIFDSWFDRYRGVMALVYVRDGSVRVGDEVSSAHSRQSYSVRSLGLLRPNEQPADKLVGGQVGFMVCNMRSAAEAHIGDTLVKRGSDALPLTGFKPARPMVFSGLFPMDQSEHIMLRSAIEKLALNDPAVSVTTDSSPVLGHGWRVGFLGLLHMEVFNQRLEQEFGAEAIMTAPSVPYKVKVYGKKVSGESEYELISDPSKMPVKTSILEILEPIVLGTIICPHEYTFKIVAECVARRGVQTETAVLDSVRAMMRFTLPLNEIIIDFHDALKAMTSGYASFDYEDHGYAPADIVKLDILMNGEIVDALSSMVHRSKAEAIGRKMCAKLVEIVPRQMIQVAIQAAVENKILARETLRAFRKDVTAKLYGGDVTRKQKLLKKQAEGKKRMKRIANINIPKEVFINFLKS